jgi:hypothetical protein
VMTAGKRGLLLTYESSNANGHHDGA